MSLFWTSRDHINKSQIKYIEKMRNLKKKDQNYTNACKKLGKEIENETSLIEGVDFEVLEVLETRGGMERADEWVALKFLKTPKTRTEVKKTTVLRYLLTQGVEIQDSLKTKSSHKFYVRIIKPEPALQTPKDILLLKQNNLVAEISKAHMEAGIFGTKNFHQKGLESNLVTFNYKDEAEMEMAIKLFLEAGIPLCERDKKDEKPCNLVFLLEFEKIKKIKRQKRIILGEEAVAAVLWILKKIYRKKIISMPEDRGNGISTRGIVEASRAQMDDIKTEIKKDFGICILVQTESPSLSGFFILTNKKSIDICEETEGKISVKNLVEKLEKSHEENVKPDRTKNLVVSKIKEIIRKTGIPVRGDHGIRKKEAYTQIHKKDEGKYKICFCNVDDIKKEVALKQITVDFEKENYIKIEKGDKTITVQFDESFQIYPNDKKIEIPEAVIISSEEKITEEEISDSEIPQNLQTNELLFFVDREERLRKLMNDPDLQGSEILLEIQKYFDEKEIELRKKELRKKEKVCEARELLDSLRKDNFSI